MEILQAVLKKYWSGSITSAEYNTLVKLLEEKSYDRNTYREEIMSLGKDPNKPLHIADAQKLLQQVHVKIALQEGFGAKKISVVRLLTNSIKWMAAAVVLLFSTKYYLQVNQKATTSYSLPSTAMSTSDRSMCITI